MLSPGSTVGLLKLYSKYTKVLIWFSHTPASIRNPLYLGKAETAVQPSTLSLCQVSPMFPCSHVPYTRQRLVCWSPKLSNCFDSTASHYLGRKVGLSAWRNTSQRCRLAYSCKPNTKRADQTVSSSGSTRAVYILPTSLCVFDSSDAAPFKLVCRAMQVDFVVMDFLVETLLACLPPTLRDASRPSWQILRTSWTTTRLRLSIDYRASFTTASPGYQRPREDVTLLVKLDI